MADAIQTTYELEQACGQVGQISRPNAPYDGDRIQIGAEGLHAGDAFKLDSAGKAIPMTGIDDDSAVAGVLGFETSMINADNKEIGNYEVDAWVPYIVEGYVLVLSGEAVDAQSYVAFDPDDGKWYATDPSTTNQHKVLIAPQAWGAENQIVEVKVGAKLY